MNMRNKKWATDYRPTIERKTGLADVDRLYSRAYLRHLFIEREEPPALQIASMSQPGFLTPG
jgi:queuine/archaeosine tRNA-ribosyltransferase